MKPGRLSSLAAGAIDRTYLEKEKGYVGRFFDFLKIRGLLIAFFFLNIVDMLTSLVIGNFYAFRSFFTSETTQAKRLTTQGEYATLFGRSFYAFLATPISFFFPKLVIFYFTPERNQSGITSGGGLHHEDHVVVKQPQDKEELVETIKQAIQEGRRIIPMGAGRSQGKQFIPGPNEKEPLVIDLQKLDDVEVHFNDGDPYAWVGAGTLWSKLQTEASKQGAAVKVMQASNVFSVGGSIGSNIHGWDYQTGMISNTIEEMEIIDAHGDIVKLTPKDELFHHVTGGLGLFGIVYRVKMKLAINEQLLRQSENVAPKDYVKFFDENLRDKPNVKLHLYRLSLNPEHLLSEGFNETYVSTDGKPVKNPQLQTEPKIGTRFQRIMVNIARRYDWARRIWWDGERQTYLNEHPVAPRNEIMQAPINAMFNQSVSEAEWLQEFFLPGEQLASFLEEFGQLMMDNDVALMNATVRFVKQNNLSPMSYAHDGDRFAVVICFNQSLQPEKIIQAKKWLRAAQKMTVDKGGSYYLPYQHVSSEEVFEKSFPYAKEAQAYKEEIDPEQRFTSGFHQTFMAPKVTEINHTKAVLGNAETRKAFKGFLKNILQRVDSDKIYALIDDILLYEDSHEGIYKELCRRLPEIMPSTLGDIRHQLSSLAAIKKELGEQARTLLPATLKSIDGIVEVGSPGRFAQGFKQHYKVTGQITAVDEDPKPSLMHSVDAGAIHPYDKYIHLDYDHLDLSSIPDNSAEVVTCYVGLHHFSEEKLDKFLKEIKRIMKKDAYFLLDDHDITDDVSFSMAYLAHLIFNAVNGVSLKDEMNEIRDFRPMSHWRKKLAEFDITLPDMPDVELIRKGDPTRNRMILAQKGTPELVATQEIVEITELSTEQEESKSNVEEPLFQPLYRATQPLIPPSNAQNSLFVGVDETVTPDNNDNTKDSSSLGMNKN